MEIKKNDFTTTVTVDATPQKAFNGINNVRGWWSENIEGRTDKLNSEFVYRDKYLTAKMKITHFTTEKIIWDVVETNNEFFKDKNEWDGTSIVFEISEKAGKTDIKFTHVGLVPQFECFTVCSNSWEFFITTSLKNLIETGKGKDISKDENSYTTSILVDKSPKEAFDAINNIQAWWSEEIEGKTNELGADFFYHHKDVHLSKMKIVELIPYQKIVWFVKNNFFNFTKVQTEWKGTKIVFEILKKDGKTQVTFTHHGLVQECECYSICETAWKNYVENSLYNLITTGIGKPNPKEKDGFDVGFVEKWKLNK